MTDRDDAASVLLPIAGMLALIAAALFSSVMLTFPKLDRPSVGGMTGGLGLVYLLAASLLQRARDRSDTSLASGMAVGASLLFALPAGFALLFMLGWGMRGHAASGGLLALLAIAALAFMIVASRSTREARGPFMLGVVSGAIVFGVAAAVLGAAL